jgi:hypothetical protein
VTAVLLGTIQKIKTRGIKRTLQKSKKKIIFCIFNEKRKTHNNLRVPGEVETRFHSIQSSI